MNTADKEGSKGQLALSEKRLRGLANAATREEQSMAAKVEARLEIGELNLKEVEAAPSELLEGEALVEAAADTETAPEAKAAEGGSKGKSRRGSKEESKGKRRSRRPSEVPEGPRYKKPRCAALNWTMLFMSGVLQGGCTDCRARRGRDGDGVH